MNPPNPMDEQIKLLKQQVAAAEFLLRNLKAQLRDAEERAGTSRDGDDGSPPHDAGSSTVRTTDPGGGNVEQHGANSERAQAPNNRREISGFLPIGGADDEPDGSDDDAPGEDENTVPGFRLPSIEVGTVYPTLEEVKNAVTGHAISQGWTCGVYKRDKTRLLLRCRTGTECPFHLRAEQYAEGAKICSLKPEHNCSFQPDQSHVPRSHASSLRFLQRELPNFMTVDANTTAMEISDAIFQRFGTRVSIKQCRQLKPGPKRKRAASVATCGKCGAVGHNRKTCGRVTEHQQTPSERELSTPV